MTNQMKHTECRLCGMNLENMVYDKYQAHISRHLKSIEEQKNQTSLGDF